jgi:AcrR family transcriptional regulator
MAIGRPRTFDIDKALDRAMKVFWRKGYEGASLPDLTRAMGISRPSLYAAFGNKESLFRKAIDRYVAGPACHVREALAQPTARGVAEKFLRGGIDLITDARNPRGCLIVQGALACGDTADAIRREMVKRRDAGETALCGRFERAIAEGDLPPETEAAELAKYLAVVAHGMAVQAAGGASREELTKVADRVMRKWPE